jgi:glycine/D-amino acid oxidase-like deaminating enzyme
MIGCDALVVGGGPGGSTCARVLHQHGWNVIIADRARFPRDKVCAGWLTPEVFPLLDLDPDEYQRTGLTFETIDAFRTGASVLGAFVGDVADRFLRDARRLELSAGLDRVAATLAEKVTISALSPSRSTADGQTSHLACPSCSSVATSKATRGACARVSI